MGESKHDYCYICGETFEDEQNRIHIEFTGRCVVCDYWMEDQSLEDIYEEIRTTDKAIL